MQGEKFLLLGTDRKMMSCKKRLEEKGYFAVCLDGEDVAYALARYNNIILPLPTVANGYITGTRLSVAELVENIGDEQRVFYGNLNGNPFGKNGISYYNESFLVINSRLTAQGVLRLILESIDVDMYSLNVAVLGYGRCGSAVCRLLQANGADVTSVSRRAYSAVCAENERHRAIGFDEFFKEISNFDVIVNTVPYNILGKDSTERLTKRNLYIEIASKPYGFNINEIDKYNFRYILAESLPGRFTPSSAGVGIADTVIEIMKEGENE